MTDQRLRVGLVACGARKLTYPAPARQLYVGPLFTMAAEYAQRTCDAWYILSAKHGCLHPDRVVEPYDATMRGLTVDRRRGWVNRVDAEFRLAQGYGLWTQSGGKLTVVVLAGAAYRDPLVHEWRRIPWEIETPLAGLGIGQQRGWFKTRREEDLAATEG